MREKCELLKQIGETSFAMLEAQLFLDTHPHDTEALCYFLKQRDDYMDAMETYQSLYGPLRADMVTADNYFCWVDNPWPWE